MNAGQKEAAEAIVTAIMTEMNEAAGNHLKTANSGKSHVLRMLKGQKRMKQVMVKAFSEEIKNYFVAKELLKWHNQETAGAFSKSANQKATTGALRNPELIKIKERGAKQTNSNGFCFGMACFIAPLSNF